MTRHTHKSIRFHIRNEVNGVMIEKQTCACGATRVLVCTAEDKWLIGPWIERYYASRHPASNPHRVLVRGS